MTGRKRATGSERKRRQAEHAARMAAAGGAGEVGSPSGEGESAGGTDSNGGGDGGLARRGGDGSEGNSPSDDEESFAEGSDLELDEEVVESTGDGATNKGRGRRTVDDGIEPPSLEGLSNSASKTAMETYRKENR